MQSRALKMTTQIVYFAQKNKKIQLFLQIKKMQDMNEHHLFVPLPLFNNFFIIHLSLFFAFNVH